jgi:hypothetical protein
LVPDIFTLNKTATVCGAPVLRSVALEQLGQLDQAQLVVQVQRVLKVLLDLKD